FFSRAGFGGGGAAQCVLRVAKQVVQAEHQLPGVVIGEDRGDLVGVFGLDTLHRIGDRGIVIQVVEHVPLRIGHFDYRVNRYVSSVVGEGGVGTCVLDQLHFTRTKRNGDSIEICILAVAVDVPGPSRRIEYV